MKATQQRVNTVLNHVAPTTKKQYVEYRLAEHGVAVVTVTNPPVNALSAAVLAQLKQTVLAANNDPNCRAIVISGGGRRGVAFIAGADISMLRAQTEGRSEPMAFLKTALASVDSLEDGPKATVAAIDGVCLGGGLEVAMACNARVVSANSSLGLPELNLGVIPGFGGTQRLPRIVGVQKALQMMITSKPIGGSEAGAVGLADVVVPKGGDVVAEAIKLAADIADGRRPRIQSLQRSDRLEPVQTIRSIAAKTLEQVRRKYGASFGDVPHFEACIDAVVTGAEKGPAIGYPRESELFVRLIKTPSARNLIHVFFASRATAKVAGVTDQSLKPRPIRRVAVIGGGTMGSGIAVSCLLRGVGVVLKEISQPLLDAGVGRIRAVLKSRVAQKRMSEAQAAECLKRLEPVVDYAAFRSVDLVIEAALEKIDLKQKIFAELEAHCSETCILASNTSTISLDVIGEKVAPATRARIVGLHYFSPAHVMPLLEIVRSETTSVQVLVDCIQFAKQTSKTPVVVGNCAGFVVNRIFHPYGQVACYLAERLGVDPYRIDRLLVGFGMPMGFFRMADMAGVDIAQSAALIMGRAYADRLCESNLMAVLVDHKRLGQKTGAGFYKYVGREAQEDPTALAQLIAEARTRSGLTTPPPQSTLTDAEIIECLLLPVINEAYRTLDENMVADTATIDVATILAMGFPAFRGGLMSYATVALGGERAVHDKLLALYRKTQQPVFKPCPLLQRAAAK